MPGQRHSQPTPTSLRQGSMRVLVSPANCTFGRMAGVFYVPHCDSQTLLGSNLRLEKDGGKIRESPGTGSTFPLLNGFISLSIFLDGATSWERNEYSRKFDAQVFKQN